MQTNKPNNQHLGFDFNDLIPELKEWNNGRSVDPKYYIAAIGNYEHAIAHGRLFWPDFTEHDDCIFFSDSFTEDNYQNWMKSSDNDKDAVQRVMNHQHISDMFPNIDPEENQIVYLGRLLKEIWQTKLNQEFPEHNFIVELIDDDEYFDELQITIYHPHNK
jgi:hypothetical protein